MMWCEEGEQKYLLRLLDQIEILACILSREINVTPVEARRVHRALILFLVHACYHEHLNPKFSWSLLIGQNTHSKETWGFMYPTNECDEFSSNVKCQHVISKFTKAFLRLHKRGNHLTCRKFASKNTWSCFVKAITQNPDMIFLQLYMPSMRLLLLILCKMCIAIDKIVF